LWSIFKNIKTPCKITIFDNASGDGTKEFLERLSIVIRYPFFLERYLSIKNDVWIKKMNSLWLDNYSQYEFFGQMQCDGFFEEDFVARFERIFDTFPEVGIVFGSCYDYEVGDRGPYKYLERNGIKVITNFGRDGGEIYPNVMGHGWMCRKSVIDKIGLPNVEYASYNAIDYYLQVAYEKGIKIVTTDTSPGFDIGEHPLLSLRGTKKYETYLEHIHKFKFSQKEDLKKNTPDSNMYKGVSIV
jgi:hypothetical protein